jgi:hypothetical protein
MVVLGSGKLGPLPFLSIYFLRSVVRYSNTCRRSEMLVTVIEGHSVIACSYSVDACCCTQAVCTVCCTLSRFVTRLQM